MLDVRLTNERGRFNFEISEQRAIIWTSSLALPYNRAIGTVLSFLSLASG